MSVQDAPSAPPPLPEWAVRPAEPRRLEPPPLPLLPKPTEPAGWETCHGCAQGYTTCDQHEPHCVYSLEVWDRPIGPYNTGVSPPTSSITGEPFRRLTEAERRNLYNGNWSRDAVCSDCGHAAHAAWCYVTKGQPGTVCPCFMS